MLVGVKSKVAVFPGSRTVWAGTRIPGAPSKAARRAARPGGRGGAPGPPKSPGSGAGFVPNKLDPPLLTETSQVTNAEAFEWARRLSKEEGLMVGISSGANMCVAAKVAARPELKGKRIVTSMCSLGERYLSTPLFDGLTGGFLLHLRVG